LYQALVPGAEIDIMLTKNDRIVVAFGAWAFLVLAVLTAFQNLSLEFYFAMIYIGLIIIVEAMGPYLVRPRWRVCLGMLVLAGSALFFVFLVIKTLYLYGESLF